MDIGSVLKAFLVGVAATFFMDILNFLAARTKLLALFRPALLGRWLAHMVAGTLIHRDIRETLPIKGEFVLGELAHYTIGGGLGVMYLYLVRLVHYSPENFTCTIGYGIATTVFAWFFMFPSWGFGFIGLKGPPLLKYTSLYNHFNYGIGLGLFFKLINLAW